MWLTEPSSPTDEVFTSAILTLTASGTALEISPGHTACGHSSCRLARRG